jgi:predicted Rossmann fold flavoprotein
MGEARLIYDVIIIGAGAAGLMAGLQASQRGKKVLMIEHTRKIGEKIRISGGGRCNFTNVNTKPENFICQNPHFVKSALSGYTHLDFVKLIESHNIAYHEKTLGQLFCEGPAWRIIDMFVEFCQKHGVDILTQCNVHNVSKSDHFNVDTDHGPFQSHSLIIASGGLSIPPIGASDFGYRIAKQFGLKIIPTRPALVPLTVDGEQKDLLSPLSGISNHSLVWHKKTKFLENILFTHRGLSGPAILQISSYLEGFNNQTIHINLLPHLDLKELFISDKNSKQSLGNYLKTHLTNRFVDAIATPEFTKSITDLKKDTLLDIAHKIHDFQVIINGSEGYMKAEVTAGGVDTNELSSKTMACKKLPHLFFIGEVVDVTGWLGGYNFQWAWSSGFAAGNNV